MADLASAIHLPIVGPTSFDNPPGSDYVFVAPGPTPPPLPDAPQPLQLGGGGASAWGQTIPVSAGTRAITGVQLWVSDPRRSTDGQIVQEVPPAVAGMSEEEYFWVCVNAWGLSNGLSTPGMGLQGFLEDFRSTGTVVAAFNIWSPLNNTGPWFSSSNPWVNPYKLPPRSTGSSAPVLPVPVEPGFVRTDFAIAFGYPMRPAAERVPITLIRMWADGNLIYGPLDEIGTPADPDVEITFYEGSPDQDPDPTIKAAVGEDCPAFRDLIYCVIKNYKLDEKKPTVPVIRAEMSDDGTANSPTAEAFLTSNLVNGDGGFFVDKSLGAYYAFSQTTINPPILHEFDLHSDSELGFVEIGTLFTQFAFVESPFWSVYDKDNRLVHFQVGDAIGNRMPVATARTDTGGVIGIFGVEDTSLVSDAAGPTTSNFGEVIKFRAFGVDGQALVTAGGVLNHITFMRYRHSVKPVASNAGQLQDLDFGGPIDPADFHLSFDATTNVAEIGGFMAYPITDRPELRNAWNVDSKPNQNGLVLVGSGSQIYAISIGCVASSTGATSMTLDQNEPIFDCGLFIDGMFLDTKSGAVMVICKDLVSSTWFLTRLIPQWVSLPNGSITIASFSPRYTLVPIEPINTVPFTGSLKQGDYSEGKFGYPVGARFVVYDLVSARKQYDETMFTGVSDDFYFNWSTASIVASRGVTNKVTRHHLFGTVDASGIPLVDFMRWCAERLGYADDEILDVDVPDTIIGTIIDSDTPIRQLMDTMSQVFDFSIVETGNTIKFVRKARGSAAAPVATLSRPDLSPLSENDDNNSIKTTIAAPDEVPADVSISYIDASMDYGPNTQIYRRVRFPFETVKTKRVSPFQVPIVMTPNDALSRAARMVYANYANSIVYEWRVPQRFIALEPSDIVTVFDNTNSPLLIQVTQMTYNADWSASLGGINWSFKDLRSENVLLPNETPRGYKPPAIHGPSESQMLAFDTTLLDPSQNVEGVVIVYSAIGSLGQSWWEGGRVFRQLNAEPEVDLYQSRTAVSYGNVTTALPATNALGTTFQTDDLTTITVRGRAFRATALQTVTADEFIAGRNAALVGRAGRWEVVFFRTITPVSDTECQISGLLRGRRGTDVFTDGHQAGDLFVPLANVNFRFDQLQATDLGKVDRYLVRGLNTTGPRQSETISPLAGNSHKPWAPRYITVELGSSINAVGSPSYDNEMGGGAVLIPSGVDRRFGCTVTGTAILRPTLLVDGDDTNGATHSAEFVDAQTNGVVLFDFHPYGFKQRITEFKWVQNNGTTHGTWITEASDDGVSWTTLEAATTLGGSVDTHTFVNPTFFWYYRLRQVTGATSNSPWLKEVYFKTMSDVDVNDVIIDWLRRDRLSPAPLFVEDSQPNTEATEAYEVDIVSGSTVLRTIAGLTAPRALYTAVQQTADGFTPPLSNVTVRVYQLSSLVGRGLTYEQTLEL